MLGIKRKSNFLITFLILFYRNIATIKDYFLSTNNKREKEREKKTKKLKKYIYISGRVIYYSRTIESIVPPSNVINIKILSPIKPSLMHGNGRR